MPSLFSIDPELLKALGGQGTPLDFTSQIGTPLESMATSQSVAGAAPVSQQGSMGFTTAEQPKRGFSFQDFASKLVDAMEGAGAVLQGRPNPVPARKNMESQMQARQEHLNLQKQQMELAKQREASNKVEGVVKLMMDAARDGVVDPATATTLLKAWGKADPDVSAVFGDHLDNISIEPKSGILTRKSLTIKDGEMIDPVTKKPLPAGDYDLKGQWRGGQFIPTEVAPSKTAGSTMTGIQAEVINQMATDPTSGKLDPDKALKVMKDMRTNPQGAESRIFDYLAEKNKSGKTDPAMEKAIKEFQGIVGGTAAQRTGGAERGRTEYRATPAFQETTEKTAESRVTGQLAGQRNAPLGQNAANYIKPDDLTTAPPTMTETEAQAKGYRAFKGASGGQFLTMARSAQNILDRLDILVDRLLPSSTGDKVKDAILVRTNQVKLAALRQARDPDVREFDALLKSNLAQFAKAAGDAANIAVPEQEFQREALPSSSDTKESGKRLLASKKAILRGVISGALGIKPLPQTGGESVDDWIKGATGRK